MAENIIPAAPDPNMLVLVQFTKKYGAYAMGAIAGFPAQQANKLISDLKAVLYAPKSVIPERKGIRGIRK